MKLLTVVLVILFSQFSFADNKVSSFLEDEKNTIKIFQDSVNSVVFISTTALANDWFLGTMEVPSGAGSGFVWDQEGHIVTNFHVVQNAQSFLVSFHGDKKQYKAKIVGVDPSKDTAVLKLIEKPKKLTPINVGSSNDLIVGQKTVAIGNPFGLDHTVTKGIVSAVGREMMGIGGVKIHDMIQTDASINQGNSGGPLLNSGGELIGMNTAILSPSGASAGIGFAVPVDSIKRNVPQLIKHGKIIRPGLGVALLSDDIKARFGIKDGVVIASINEKGPASKAGLKGISRDRSGRYYIGDVILAINDKKINNFDDIYQQLDQYKIGEEVTVLVERDGKKFKKEIKLTEI